MSTVPVMPETVGWTPLVIAVAPNGARKGKADHPRLPITTDEIAAEARACCEAGASLLHLHVRDGNGEHSLDVATYRQALAAVDQAVGRRLVVQVTTEAVGRYQAEEQMTLLRQLRPEAASVAWRELSRAGEAEAVAFYGWAREQGIALQHILYEPQEIAAWAAALRRHGQARRGLSVLLVFGRHGGGHVGVDGLTPLLAALRETGLQAPQWSVCAFADAEGPTTLAAMALGGHVRVGFENNLRLNCGALAPDNAALVTQAAVAARLLGRPLADAAEVRGMWEQKAA